VLCESGYKRHHIKKAKREQSKYVKTFSEIFTIDEQQKHFSEKKCKEKETVFEKINVLVKT